MAIFYPPVNVVSQGRYFGAKKNLQIKIEVSRNQNQDLRESSEELRLKIFKLYLFKEL